MKVTLHLDLDERDYIILLNAAGMKGMTSEDFIKQAIRSKVEEVGKSMAGQIPKPKRVSVEEEVDKGDIDSRVGDNNKEDS